MPLTLRQALERYYAANPTFTRNQDLWVGRIRVPWRDLQKHDIMHVITGYSTELDQELQLIGFLLTAITWKRPWYFYLQSVGVFLELLGRSLTGKTYGARYLSPLRICRLYGRGIRQGRTVRRKIDAYIDPEPLMDSPVSTLRQDYGIANAGAWDDVDANNSGNSGNSDTSSTSDTSGLPREAL